MSRLFAFSIALFAPLAPLAVSLAAADPKPAPGTTHSPPVILDEATAMVWVNERGSEGYGLQSHVEIHGMSAATDAVRLDWTSGGKVVASAKCRLRRSGAWGYGACEYNDQPVKATGPIEAHLIYRDDTEEKEYLVRTFKLTVKHFTGLYHSWTVFPDDVLGGAWLELGNDDKNDMSGTYRKPTLYLWFATGEAPDPLSLRCTVDGTKIEDFDLYSQSGSDQGEFGGTAQPKTGDGVTYRWRKAKFLISKVWGSRATLEGSAKRHPPEPGKMFVDNPGTWDCNLRREGKTIRQLRFVVDQDGMIQNDEIQQGKHPIPSAGNRTVFIENRLTKDSASFDKRIVPGAYKQSLQYGLPWPEHPKVKALHDALPPKSGLPDPK